MADLFRAGQIGSTLSNAMVPAANFKKETAVTTTDHFKIKMSQTEHKHVCFFHFFFQIFRISKQKNRIFLKWKMNNETQIYFAWRPEV